MYSPTTTQTTTTQRPAVVDLMASKVSNLYVCRGNSTRLQIPKDYNLYPMNVYYGVTSTQTCTGIR